MAKVRTQAERRQHATIYDNHRRKWWTVIEKDTMRSCGPMVPRGWEPPLLLGKTPFVPPETYHRYKPDDPFEFTIDYDTWIADLEREQESYRQRISSAAIMQFGSGATDAIKRQSPELLAYVGPPPMPVAPVKAAKAGNLYVLGLSKNMPKWADPYFTKPTVEEELFPNVEDDYPDDTPEPIGELEATSDEFPDVEEPADVQIIDDEIEDILDIEEEHDPQATGGKRVDPRDAKRAEPPKEKPKPVRAKAGK